MNRLSTAGLVLVIASALLVVQPAPVVANLNGTNVVISEVQSRAANVDNEIANAVELYNPTGGWISLNGWTLQSSNSSGNPTLSFGLTGISIPGGGFLVITHPDYQPVPIKDGTMQVSYTPTSGVDAIPDLFGICLLDDEDQVVDAVGTTSSLGCVENSPTSSLNAQTDLLLGSIQRDWMATDTDNNAADFEIRIANWGWLES